MDDKNSMVSFGIFAICIDLMIVIVKLVTGFRISNKSKHNEVCGTITTLRGYGLNSIALHKW